jgi:hypothetical protein
VSNNGPVSFGPIRTVGESALVVVETREESGHPPWLQEIRTSMECLRVEGRMTKERSLGPGIALRRYEYHASIVRMPAIGPLTGEISVLASSNDASPVLTIPVNGLVRDRISVYPKAILVRRAPKSHLRRSTVRLVSNDADFDLQVTPADSNPDYLNVEIQKVTKNTVLMDVSVRYDYPYASPFTIRLNTNQPALPVVVLPGLYQSISGGVGEYV